MTLERKKQEEQDEIIDNLETIIAKEKKQRRKDKVKNLLLEIGLGVAVAVEAGIIINLMLR